MHWGHSLGRERPQVSRADTFYVFLVTRQEYYSILIGCSLHESFTDWLGTELEILLTRGLEFYFGFLHLQDYVAASGFSGNRMTYTYFQNLGDLEQGNA